MTVTVQTPFNEHTANGVTTVFGYTFKLLLSTDLEVKIDGVVQSSGYTVSGLGVNSGGDVTFTTAPANLAVIQLARKIPISRSTDYQVNGDLPSDEVDDDYDRLWLALQDAAYFASRTLSVPAGDTATSTELPSVAERASQYPAFDASGNPIASSGLASVPVSVAMAAVVTAATLALGRTALGAAASGANGDVTSLTALASINGGQIGGVRNGLINGGFSIDQVAAATTADDTYQHDGWYALTQTNTIAITTLTDVEDGTPYAARLTQSQAVAQRMGYAQIIESKRCKHLRGKTVTFRLGRTRLSASANVRYAILEWTGTADAATSDVINDWTSSTYTAGNFFNSTTLTVSTVVAQALTAATLTTGSDVTVTLGSTFNNLIVVAWTEAAAAQNVTFDLAKAQIEIGAVSSAFEYPEYADELQKCQRYYEVITAAINGASGGTTPTAYWFFKATKMTTPTIVEGGGSAKSAVDALTADFYGINRTGGNTPVIGSGTTASARL